MAVVELRRTELHNEALLFTRYYRGCQSKKDNMGGECSAHGVYVKCLRNCVPEV